MKMKKLLAVVLICCMMAALITGCAKEKTTTEDPNTLTIAIRHDQYLEFYDAMKAEFPEINFEFDYYIGDDSSDYLSGLVASGQGGDLLFNTLFLTQPEYTQNMLDLSGYSFVGNIRDEIVNMISVEDSIYFLPAPMDIRCMIYNKTLFEEYGWKMPNNLDELVALVKQIRKDAPDITPIGMTSKSAGYGFTTITTFAQCGFLSTPAGYQWEQDFFNGKASFGEGMDEGITITEMLIDAGAFDPEKYTGSSKVDKNLVARDCAMIFEWSGIKGYLDASTAEGVTDEFGFFPFYGLNGEKLLAHNTSATLAINKKLGEPGNEQKLANALKVMEWFISNEAQELIKANETQLSVTKDTNNDAATALFAELMELSKGGYTASMLYSGYEDLMAPVGNAVFDAFYARSSEGMREAIVTAADAIQKGKLEGDSSAYYGELTEHFTNAQTAQFVADAMYASGLGDFALITHSDMKDGVVNDTGAAGRLNKGFFGDIQAVIISTERNGFVATLDLTGAQVKTLLEQGKTVHKMEGEASVASAAFPYYWSGIDVTMKDGKVTSVKLNGKELENDSTYTVVFQAEDCPPEFAADAIIKEENMMSSIVIDYVKANTPLKAPEVLRK